MNLPFHNRFWARETIFHCSILTMTPNLCTCIALSNFSVLQQHRSALREPNLFFGYRCCHRCTTIFTMRSSSIWSFDKHTLLQLNLCFLRIVLHNKECMRNHNTRFYPRFTTHCANGADQSYSALNPSNRLWEVQAGLEIGQEATINPFGVSPVLGKDCQMSSVMKGTIG